MKRAIAIVIVALWAVSPALARLGETEKEIIARFGEGNPSKGQRQAGARTMKYLKNGFQIEVVFDQGKSIMEIYHRLRGGGAFPEADIENLLDSYRKSKKSRRRWRYDRRDKRWESTGKPKYVAYHWPGHRDFFCIKNITACEALDKGNPGSKDF